MTTSEKGFDFIKSREGCKLKAYQDSAGIWSIGYGFITLNGHPVKSGDTITQQQADEQLQHEIHSKETAVIRLLGAVRVRQNQFDAIVSFAYNVGVGALAGSTLLKLIKSNPDDPAILGEFLMYNKVRIHGKLVYSKGLNNRRLAEWALYSS